MDQLPFETPKKMKFPDYTAYIRYQKQMNFIRQITDLSTNTCTNEKLCNDNLEMAKYNLRKL